MAPQRATPTDRARLLLRRLLLALGVGGVLWLLRRLLEQVLTPRIDLRHAPLRPALSAPVPTPARPTKKHFAAFLSHCKGDAAMEARYLQGELERGTRGRLPIFLDSDDLRMQT